MEEEKKELMPPITSLIRYWIFVFLYMLGIYFGRLLTVIILCINFIGKDLFADELINPSILNDPIHPE